MKNTVALCVLLIVCQGCQYNTVKDSAYKDMPGLVQFRDILYNFEKEDPGYGLYTYILFAREPQNEDQRKAYIKILTKYLSFTSVKDAPGYIGKEGINITYLPLKKEAKGMTLSPEIIIDKLYNYVHARMLLKKVDPKYRYGPYIISYEKPIGLEKRKITGKYGFQNMTGVESELANLWVDSFLSQIEKTNYWEEDKLNEFILELRNFLLVTGKGMYEIASSIEKLEEIIKVVNPK